MRCTRASLVPLALLAAAVLPGGAPPGGGQGMYGEPDRVHMRWTLPVRPGQREEASELAFQTANYLAANHPEAVPHVGGSLASTQRGTMLSRAMEFESITVFVEATSMAALRNVVLGIQGEEGWLSLEQRMGEVFDLDRADMTMLLPVVAVDEPAPDRTFRWERVARTTYGNHAMGLRHATAIARYVAANYDDVALEVYLEDFEEFGVVHLSGDFRTVDAWRVWRTRLLQDEGYLDLLEQASGVFVDGSVGETGWIFL